MNLKIFKRMKKDNWKYTDFIISIDDIVHDLVPYFKKNDDIIYTCIRDYRNICIYIEEDKFEKFQQINSIYHIKDNMINISNLLLYQKSSHIFCEVFNKTSPMSVEMKYFVICKIDDIEVIITMDKSLYHQDPLFRDLINLQSIKDKYNFR